MYGNPMIDNAGKQPGLNKHELVSRQDAGVGFKREWKCKRCECEINIHVPDAERTFVIDGENIFCGKICLSAYKAYVPVRLSRTKAPVKAKKKTHQKKENAIFKCFHCTSEFNYMTFDKLCPRCRSTMSYQNQMRIDQGEFITGMVGELTNEQRSQIRLSKIN